MLKGLVVNTQTFLNALDLVRHDFEKVIRVCLAQPVPNLLEQTVNGTEPFTSASVPSRPKYLLSASETLGSWSSWSALLGPEETGTQLSVYQDNDFADPGQSELDRLDHCSDIEIARQTGSSQAAKFLFRVDGRSIRNGPLCANRTRPFCRSSNRADRDA